MKKLVIFAVVVTLSIPLYAQQEERVKPYDVLVRSANIYLGLKPVEYDKAWNLLKQAVDNYPDALEAHYLMGIICSDRAQYREMMVHFRKFEELCSKEAMAADKKFQKRCEKDKMPEQIRNIRLSSLKKSFGEGVDNLKMADSIGRAEGAADDTTKAKRQKTIDALLAKARGVFEDCVILDDTVSIVWTNLGTVLNQQGNRDTAIVMYMKSYQLNPNDKDLLFALASTLYKQQEYGRAAKFYGEFAMKDTVNAEAALINQAMCYQAMKDDDSLIASLDRILKINPENPDIRYQRGVYYVRKASAKSLQDSSACLDSLSEVRPNDKSLEKAKADLTAYRLNFYNDALPDFKKAAEVAKSDADYWYWYGNAAYLSNKIEEARTAYEECVKIKDEHKECWCQLENIFAKLNIQAEFDKAKKKCDGL